MLSKVSSYVIKKKKKDTIVFIRNTTFSLFCEFLSNNSLTISRKRVRWIYVFLQRILSYSMCLQKLTSARLRESRYTFPQRRNVWKLKLIKGSLRILKVWRVGRIGRDFALYIQRKK